MEKISVCGEQYSIIRLLGHGKGGYSYLAERDGQQYTLKQIHHEPCAYYTFGNKIEAERHDYERLCRAGIRIPKMIAIDSEKERVLKEYIEGETVFDMIRDGLSAERYLPQIRQMAASARENGLNIDYFPTNFVVRDGLIWYVDYECNEYMDHQMPLNPDYPDPPENPGHRSDCLYFSSAHAASSNKYSG